MSLETNIHYLEPADEHGVPDAFFRKLLQHQANCGTGFFGRIYARPPRAAVIGKGNSGIVWRGMDARDGHLYAVKNVDANTSKRECEIMQLLATCTPPFVVRVIGVHKFNDVPLASIVMNLCIHGDMLLKIQMRRENLKDKEYIYPAQSSLWTKQLFSCLEYLHLNLGIYHRDIKPGNILISSGDCLQLADFGVSCVSADLSMLNTNTSYIAGTPGYIAPEILASERYDWRADIYSSGACMWVLLCGGEKGQNDPAPPSNKHLMLTDGDTAALNEDWVFLVEAIERTLVSATGNFRAAMELIMQLVTRNPDARLCHSGIQACPFCNQLEY
uniref:Protein kinase domain-containing protein n=1 Tax=viral metagenome TaxID=1070528 RepID=A0A6C0C2J2_9ZZZZ